jgi:hypothetical protein
MSRVDSSDFPSIGEIQEMMGEKVDAALDSLSRPLTEKSIDAALKGIVDSWNWRLTWSSEFDDEEAEALCRAEKPVDVLIFGFDKNGNKNFAGYRARMLVKSVV